MEQSVLPPKCFLVRTVARIPVVLPDEFLQILLVARLSVRVPLNRWRRLEVESKLFLGTRLSLRIDH